MQTARPPTFSESLRRNPLVPAAAIFLAGAAAGCKWDGSVAAALAGAIYAWLFWLAAEIVLKGRHRCWIAQSCLALVILFSGMALGQLNQHYVPRMHVARFADGVHPVPLTARLRVVTPPGADSGHGNLYWIGSATEILTDHGWLPAAGDMRIKWRSAERQVPLHRGDVVEVCGWLTRPETAMNPGAMDLRQTLAADRIFAQLRIPRATGLVMLSRSGLRAGSDTLTRVRLFLRSKLLEHTLQVDPQAGYAMVALLLGHRDPAIAGVSQAFADAGVAHLLAISGSHVVFFTAMVWGILCVFPLRPRWREGIVALIVLVYVLATPCGPPIVRAAVAVLMVLLARLLGRPRIMLNMLAAAAVIVVLLRPADIFDAGFQLSFICTVSLILLAPRLYAALFGGWLMRQEIVADLNGARLARWKLKIARSICGLLTANIIGAATAAPLVALHFGRANVYGVFAGLIALPIVALTMGAAAVQLLLELLWTKAALFAAPLSAGIARGMVWTVEHLASLPMAAVALRAPPPWLIIMVYAAVILWAARHWLQLSRASVINGLLAALAITAGWYALTAPVGELRISTLSVGQGSSIVIRMPSGELWLVNAGSRDAASLVDRAVAPTLRLAGESQLHGIVLTSLNTVAAQSAAEAIDRFHPPVVLTSAAEWQHRGETFAGNTIESAMTKGHIRHLDIAAGSRLNTGHSSPLRVLWPMENSPPRPQAGLVLLCAYQNRRVLFVDPAATASLGLLEISGVDVRADAVVFLGPQRGKGDAALRQLLIATGAKTLIWSGRTAWAPANEIPGEYNTAAGAVEIRINASGDLAFSR